MTLKIKIVSVVFALIIIGCGVYLFASSGANTTADILPPQVELSKTGESWTRRCADNGKKDTCEVFQSLIMVKQKIRLVEVAVGFIKDGNAKMAVMLPLGIVVGKGIGLQVDSSESLAVPVHSCNKNGCSIFVNLTPKFLKSMKEGNILNVAFLDSKQTKIKVEMSLAGFSKALSGI